METWLQTNVNLCELFPVMYDVYRSDHKLQLILILLRFIWSYVNVILGLNRSFEATFCSKDRTGNKPIALVNFRDFLNLKQLHNILDTNNRLLDFVFYYCSCTVSFDRVPIVMEDSR